MEQHFHMSPTCKKTPWTPRPIALRQGGQPLGPKSVVIWKCFTTLCQRFYRLSISPSVLKICFFKVRAYGPIGVISLNFLTVKIMLKIRLKAVGGVQGVFCMLSSYESTAPYGVSAFYRLLISPLVLKICSVKVQPHLPKWVISLPIHPLLKNNSQNEPY